MAELWTVEWHGRKLNSIRDIIDNAFKITDEAEKKRFVDQVKASNPHALSNIGYCSGYYSTEQAAAILKFFGTTHPIFGPDWPATPISAKDAFELGQRMGKKLNGNSNS